MVEQIPNDEKWVIRVTPRELLAVFTALSTSHRSIGIEGVAWLTRTAAKRVWVIRERATTAWFLADCEADDPYFALPITLDFLEKMLSVAARTGGGLDISCDPNDGSIVARSGDFYVSVDHPEDLEFTEEDMPFIPSEGGNRTMSADAVVSMSDAQLFASMVFDNNKSIGGKMPPFAQMEIKYDSIRWTIDWRGFEGGRASGRVPARTKGTASLEFFPYALADMLGALDGDDTDFVRFYVDSDEPDYLYVVAKSWGTRTVLDDEHVARWTTKVKAALERTGIEVPEEENVRLSSSFELAHEDKTFFVSIDRHIDEPGEYLVLSHYACRDIPSSPELLDQLNSLNQILYGSKVYWSFNDVHVETIVPISALDQFEDHFEFFRTAMEMTRGLDAYLPLFLVGDGTEENEETE